MLRVGLLGFGAIGRSIMENWHNIPPGHCELTAICSRPHQPALLSDDLRRTVIVHNPEQFLDLRCGAVIEAAGHDALKRNGAHLLQNGVDLYILSVGALADADLLASLRQAAVRGGGRACLASGAIAGIDGLRTMRMLGLNSVRYRATKPPAAWPDTIERALPGDRRHVVFEGNAREAARRYPRNANVAATVALAGLGFEATQVQLISDPAAAANMHEIVAVGEVGELHLRIAGRPLAANRKSSASAGMSVIVALSNGSATPAFV